jgi:hypothetical protein
MQNILNYSAEKLENKEVTEDELRIGAVVIGHDENGYFILCGNKVYNSDIAGIKDKIDEIRDRNKDELKALYKERRRMEPVPGSKGAGLGFIEMARKSSEPINYSFTPIDNDFSFFTIRVVVSQ